jgi:hypothetical protein
LTADIPKAYSLIQHPGPKPTTKEKNVPKPKENPKEKPKAVKQTRSNAFDEEEAPKNFKYEFKEPVKILTRLQRLQAKDPSIGNRDLEEGRKLTEHQQQLLRDKTGEMRERFRRGDFKLATTLPV